MDSWVVQTVGRKAALLMAAMLVVSGCSPSETQPSSTATSSTATTTSTPTTTTTVPETSTTTEAPIIGISVEGVDDGEITDTLEAGLTTLRDPRADGPLTQGVKDHHATPLPLEDVYEAEVTTAELEDGSRVGVATLDSGDLLLLADEGPGWEIAGTHLTSVDADPYFGESPRRVLVLGSDARPGGDPLVHRMDSIHILTSVPTEHAGAILGYPRDSWIDSPYGSMRINALTSSGRGPNAIFDHFTETWGVPLEGYIVTGFAGFEDLIAATLGRIHLTIPINIPTQEWFAGFSKGEQTLNPTRTLDFARTRKLIPGGDLTRSYHQGIVMLAALAMIQEGSVHGLPSLVAALSTYTTTDLTATDLIQLAAAAMEMDIAAVTNEVLPATLGRAGGGASVVFLDPGFEEIVGDVVDDGLRNHSTD